MPLLQRLMPPSPFLATMTWFTIFTQAVLRLFPSSRGTSLPEVIRAKPSLETSQVFAQACRALERRSCCRLFFYRSRPPSASITLKSVLPPPGDRRSPSDEISASRCWVAAFHLLGFDLCGSRPVQETASAC